MNDEISTTQSILTWRQAAPSQNVLDLVCRIAHRMAPIHVPVEPSHSLRSDLGYHSLTLVELAFALEEIFSIGTISGEETIGIESVQDVARYIAHALARDEGSLPDEAHVEAVLEIYAAGAEAF